MTHFTSLDALYHFVQCPEPQLYLVSRNTVFSSLGQPPSDFPRALCQLFPCSNPLMCLPTPICSLTHSLWSSQSDLIKAYPCSKPLGLRTKEKTPNRALEACVRWPLPIFSHLCPPPSVWVLPTGLLYLLNQTKVFNASGPLFPQPCVLLLPFFASAFRSQP